VLINAYGLRWVRPLEKCFWLFQHGEHIGNAGCVTIHVMWSAAFGEGIALLEKVKGDPQANSIGLQNHNSNTL